MKLAPARWTCHGFALAISLSIGFWMPGSAQGVATRLSDAEFLRLVTEFSEPEGNFPSENFASNEHNLQSVIPELLRSATPESAYIGVGPEQNFTYIAALRPRIAFIVDIRRQAILQHLLYKALFELAPDRADFLSLLFSRPRPLALDSLSTSRQLFDAYEGVPPDSALCIRTLAAVTQQLVGNHRFAIDRNDLAGIAHVFEVIRFAGPELNMGSGDAFKGYQPRASRTDPKAFAMIMAEKDNGGVQRSFLASEQSYREIRDLQSRNLIVPVVGDFAGPKALRSIGKYLRDRGAVVSTFYTSNVESILFQEGGWRGFYSNVRELPMDGRSLFVRWLPGTVYGQALGSMTDLLAALSAGTLQNRDDLVRLSRH